MQLTIVEGGSLKFQLPLASASLRPFNDTYTHGRPHIGANGVSWPPWKMGEKLKSENMQKGFLCYPRESEKLCFYRRWFVCLFVCLFVTTITK